MATAMMLSNTNAAVSMANSDKKEGKEIAAGGPFMDQSRKGNLFKIYLKVI